jgi:hypothetical protein
MEMGSQKQTLKFILEFQRARLGRPLVRVWRAGSEVLADLSK